MKRLLLLQITIFASLAWPNACTLSSSMNLSASGGQWTGTGCTGASYIPGNGDTATIAANIKLTVDQNWTIGASGASNTTAAIHLLATNNVGAGTLEVKGGATLTLRGDLLYDSWTSSGTNIVFNYIVMDAGSGLAFDSSQASSPTTTRYRAGWSGSGGGTYGRGNFDSVGTACATEPTIGCPTHVTVTSVNTNGALNGQFRGGSNTVGATVPSQAASIMTAYYTDFSNIGDTTTYGDSIAMGELSGDAGTVIFSHDTFTNVSAWLCYNTCFTSLQTGDAITNNLWQNSPQALGSPQFGMATDSSGSVTINNNVFDRCIGYAANSVATSFTNNYFGDLQCSSGIGTGNTMYDNFWRSDQDLGTRNLAGNYSMTGGYVFVDFVQDNPHFINASSTVSQTWRNIIYEAPEDVTADSGVSIQPSPPRPG